LYGTGAYDTLEIDGQEKESGEHNKAMAKASGEGGNIRALLEDPERHYGILGDFPLSKQKENPGEDSKDNQADDNGGGPGV
jgi:hypothetical protein